MNVNQKIAALRHVMKEKGIDVYYVPTSDDHDSEYVSPHYQCRAWLSGFTGSAGYLVVTPEKAVLWSDGRYFIQAERQVKGTCIDFYHMNDADYPTLEEFIVKEIGKQGTLGFDGSVVSIAFGETMEHLLQAKDAKICWDQDLVGMIWPDRPGLPVSPLYALDTAYAGKSVEDKLTQVRRHMHELDANRFVLTALDDIAWLFNIRADDVTYNPVALAFAMINEKDAILYVDPNKVDKNMQEYFVAHQIQVKDYSTVYEDLSRLNEKDVVLYDEGRCNYKIKKVLSDQVRTIHEDNYTSILKAVKNETERKNIRLAHIRDGVAVTKFMAWLKKNVGKIDMDELSVDEQLTTFRKAQEHYLDKSFGTIAAYNANAAMMHYGATEESKATIQAEGILLVDSGGQYLEGTTDITRTFALGAPSDAMKKDFTLVLLGMIRLAKAHFLEGCSGMNLDILARQPLWDLNIDYKCGTGHGVGYFLNVHEGPQGIRWYVSAGRKEDTPLKEGMLVSDEPGIYIEGSHGIRCENLLLVQKDEKNEWGQFMSFETVTMVPFDKDLIDEQYLDDASLKWLNDYHQEVYEKISPYLDAEEKTWLASATSPIERKEVKA